jgi:hypothetical protein
VQARYPWLWDTNLDNDGFEALLRGRAQNGAHDDRWAMVRLIEYAPFSEIKRLLPRESFLSTWPELSSRVRSSSRREGMDFFYQWLKDHLPVNG